MDKGKPVLAVLKTIFNGYTCHGIRPSNGKMTKKSSDVRGIAFPCDPLKLWYNYRKVSKII